MATISRKYANPTVEEYKSGGMWFKEINHGLTKREHFAGQILAGISANRWSMELGNYTYEQLAEIAVKQADALLYALSKAEN